MKNYSDYHRINVKDKITNDAQFIFDRTINGYAGKEVEINGKTVKALIQQKYDADGEAYKIVGYPQDIERGKLITYKGEKWLITTKPEDNDIYKKATMTLCTEEFPITTPPTKELIGYDNRGRPIYEETPGTTIKLPCVVKFNDASTAIADTNKPINLLDNQITVTITYTEADSIALNEEFEMFGDKYRIIRINPSDSINKIGILHITGLRFDGGESE